MKGGTFMDEDQPSLCLKRFGFLPANQCKKQQRQKNVGRRKSERYYLRECQGIYLTSREAEASALIAKGCTVRESADRMSLSPRTVEFYLSNVRRKLGVRNKNELLHTLYDKDFFQQFH